jgi:hypothetical protein
MSAAAKASPLCTPSYINLSSEEEIKRVRLRSRLANPDALLSRTDLRELGLERRAVDAVFRALDVIVLPGYSRPLVRVVDYLELLERSTYDDSRVR